MASITLQGLTASSHRRPAAAYSPDLLPLLQSLLRTLADLDAGFQQDIETVAKCPTGEILKQQALAGLKQRHHEQRAPYLQEIARLQKQVEATFR